MYFEKLAHIGISAAFVVALASPSFAQPVAQANNIDCEDEANREEEACLVLLPNDDPITNFVPLIAPLAGLGVLAAAAGGGGSTVSTTSTTSTTSP